MTENKLKELNKLSKDIADLKGIIKNGKTQTCEWIEFTFGNGSNRLNVCNDKDIIKQIRDLIVKENELKLERLEDEFKKL